MSHDFSPAMLARFRRGAASAASAANAANAELLRLAAVLREAEELAAAYRAAHLRGCRCDFCRSNVVVTEGIAAALDGVSWAMMMARAQIDSATYPV